MVAGAELPASVEFGRFRVLPHRRELLVDGQPAKLGGRAFDVLTTLIEARGAVVTKDALMARVWPGQIVEENNLQSHISALRAALGPDRELVRTVSGRGYQFIGEMRTLSEADDVRDTLGPEAAKPAALPATNVPEPVSELIGRDDELAKVVILIVAHRLVTLTGAGGIGKTRLAVALARKLRPHFADGVWLAQFSPLADPKLVPATVAAAEAWCLVKRGKGLRMAAHKRTTKANPLNLYAIPRARSVDRFKDQIRNLTRRKAPVRLCEVIGAINPIIRGWGNYYRKANVRKLFHQLDGWIERRLWSFIAKRWRNTAYRKYPTRRLVTELGLIRLISLVPGITMLLTPARRPHRKAACGEADVIHPLDIAIGVIFLLLVIFPSGALSWVAVTALSLCILSLISGDP